MKKREIIMLASLSFSMGVVLGFILSPVKQGITNVIGNTTNNNYNDDEHSTDLENKKYSGS
jgi:hypothetical protein